MFLNFIICLCRCFHRASVQTSRMKALYFPKSPLCLIKATKEFNTAINMDISWLTPSFCSAPGHLVNTKLPHIFTVEVEQPIRKEQRSRVTALSYLLLCFTRPRRASPKIKWIIINSLFTQLLSAVSSSNAQKIL